MNKHALLIGLSRGSRKSSYHPVIPLLGKIDDAAHKLAEMGDDRRFVPVTVMPAKKESVGRPKLDRQNINPKCLNQDIVFSRGSTVKIIDRANKRLIEVITAQILPSKGGISLGLHGSPSLRTKEH